MRTRTLQGAAVVDQADSVRVVVVDQQPVFDVLLRLDEVDAELVELAAGPGVLDPLHQPHIALPDGAWKERTLASRPIRIEY
jgi:hypothetical protein